MSDTQQDINQMKEAEFYSANLNAWFNTRFEHDKSLLTLSAGGLGLLITLISTVGVKSIESLILYVFSLLCFILCLGTLLWIFRRNAKYLEDVVKETAIDDKLLNILDRIAVASFMLGVLLAAIIGISIAVNSYIEKSQIMIDKKSAKVQAIEIKSVNGITSMRPSGEVSSSVNGISNMRPTTNQPSATSQTQEEGKK